MFYSPLRYPGGKNKLSGFIAKLCIDNKINGHYVEPYAGGASVALFLLFEGFVNKITINDKDKSIYAFWHCVLNNTTELCALIKNTDISFENWLIQRGIQKRKDQVSLIELGFSTLFLNRTNISGIIMGGVIGGKQQEGSYKMDCRFNKEELIKRIKNIASKKEQITLCSYDAIVLIDKIEEQVENKNIVFYFDPPYYLKASSLYMNHYKNDDHQAVSERIKKIKNIKWIVSYDNQKEIRNLYLECVKKEYSFTHTAYSSRIGNEILFFSNDLQLPCIENWSPLGFKLSIQKKIAQIIYKHPVPRV
ncbi:DNA adenine methylase [Parasediminibacterium sp. JCM 36343]|uniref:DNA adenine methylase n=1 Tax=Parasediminibacterium sp. JCM 36343 TaxID=3374279 RepID=UPI00397C6813